MKTIYLCGPINHIPPEKAMTWRKAAARILTKDGMIVLDPCAGKDLFAANVNTTAYTPEYIVERDLAMIDSADILLVDVSRDCPCWGSAMEVRYAYERGKEIYTWGRFAMESYWVRYHATKRFPSFVQALSYLRKGAAVNKDYYTPPGW
jgi:nucleoside 2-deoxyribosyltransferase